jgi:phosphatidylethanolamine-binding protein (PEBP) family uncharacterized protein
MFEITYGLHKVSGKLIPSKFTQTQPKIKFTMKPDTLYTIIMVDPDAPTPDFLHWLLINIDATKAETIADYYPPTPPSGIHRYYFYLCAQLGPLKISKIQMRSEFNTPKFIKINNLSIVKETMFKSKSKAINK